MSSVLRSQSNVLFALGAGIAIGACAAIALLRLTSSLDRKLAHLLSTIETLQQEVHQLHSRLEQTKLASSLERGGGGVEKDEDDEDEEFEDTVEIDENEFKRLQHLPTQTVEPTVEAGRTGRDRLVSADECRKLYSQVDRLMESSDTDKERAMQLLDARQTQLANDADYLWRVSKACYLNALIHESRGDDVRRRQLFFRSVDVIKSALERGEHLAPVHKWYAITLGKLGDFLGTQEKIKNGFIFKEHIERAISIDPKDSSSYYLLGRWCYGVYMLTWLERKAAAALFATPPSSTVDEALQQFLKAEQLADKPWKENRLFVAKCYVEKRDYAQAAHWLQEASSLPTKSADDKTAQTEIESLISKYGRYAQ